MRVWWTVLITVTVAIRKMLPRYRVINGSELRFRQTKPGRPSRQSLICVSWSWPWFDPKSPIEIGPYASCPPPSTLSPLLVYSSGPSSMAERVVGSSPAAAGKGAATAAPRHNLVRTFKYLMGSSHVLPLLDWSRGFFLKWCGLSSSLISATQFLSRGIPFIFNSWIVRHLTAADYAVIFLRSNSTSWSFFCCCFLYPLVIITNIHI